MDEAPKAMMQETPVAVVTTKTDEKKESTVPTDGLITIDQFFQTSLKIGTRS